MISPKVRILVADDHYVVRAGLRNILAEEPGFVVVGEATNGREAITACAELKPDVVIMDIRMPMCGGIEAATDILKTRPSTKIIVLSNFEGSEDIHLALKAGAAGYLLKHSSGDQIVPAIWAAFKGDTWIPPEVSATLAKRKFSVELTPREKEILNFLAKGEANKQIADATQIGVETVKSHVKSILAKLGVRDRTEAVTVALRRGIIHLPKS